jgi:hypothetical protein
MKKQMLKTISNVVRSRFIPVLLFSVLTLSSNAIFAQEITSTGKPEVKYVGKVEDQLLFQVNYENNSNEAYTVAVKDEDGNLLYTDRFKDKKFSKQFRVTPSEYGNMKLVFVFSNDKEKQTQVVQINTNTRVVDDVVVTKL